MRGGFFTKAPATGLSRRNNKRCLSERLEDRRVLAVMISEFMADNETTLADADGDFSDWIEVRNSGADAVELGGWYLTDSANDLTKWEFPDTQLQAGDQLLVFASDKDRRIPNRELHANFKLSGDGEYLALVRPDAVTVEHAYDPSYPSQSDDLSYGLSADGSEEGYFSEPTPGSRNLLAPTGDPAAAIVISEIMYGLPRADLLDAENIDEEFIELHNRGDTSVDLSGWRITRGVDFAFANVTIPVGGYLVVSANMDSFGARYPGVYNVVGGWTGKLSNNGETIELVDRQGRMIDRVRYASEGDWSVRTEGPADRGSNGWIWLAGHDGGNKSLELVNASLPNDSGQNWTSSGPDGGTPGKPNSAAATNSAPLISEVIHAPAIPRANDEVTVTARLLDESPNVSARLHWRVDSSPEFTVVQMVDDGQGADTLSGDGRFAATIPAHTDRAVIEFFVEAIDTSGNHRTWPAPTASGVQAANALYQVLDEFDQDATWNPENVPVYFQVMTASERDAFANTVRQSDAQYNATFIVLDGTGVDVRYNAGVRYRGSASRDDRVPPNRINIPNDRDWQGVTRINMNPANPVNNVAGAALFRLAGVEMADARGVRMFSNGVDFNQGLYAHVEVLDDGFAAVHHPHDSQGNIYRGRRPDESPPGGRGAGLRYFGPEPAPYVSYVKNTNASEADWSDVIRLTDVLNNSPDETYVQDVLQVVDVDQWFRAFAMNSLIGNNENGLFTGDGQGDDYAMYRGATDQRFLMIPYDLDSLFVTGGFGGGRINGPLDEPTEVPALDRLINHPEFRRRYYAHYVDLINNVLQTDSAEAALRQTLRGIASEGRIGEILDFLRQRADYVLGEINQEITIDAATGTSSGLPRTSTPAVTLAGESPEAATVSMTVNGYLVETIDAERDWSFDIGGNQTVESDTLVASASSWRYLDDGSDQGTAWRESGFDDGTWQEGRAQLGYGDGDEATEISNGPGQQNAATSYFRSTFTVTDLSRADTLSVRLAYDDAAAVYINGTGVVRTDNLAADAAFDTFATGTRPNQVENDFVSFDVGPEVLVTGSNTIAVEVHQASATSSDLSFDLELVATHVETIDVEVPDELQLFPGLNRYTVRAFDDVNGGGQLVAEEKIDVWFDDGSTETISSDISTDTIWQADLGPYLINGNVTLTADATLTIEPGTTVFFADSARLTVRGRLQAIGSPLQEVRFTRQPGASEWNGIQFRDSMSDNRIEHAILEYGVTNDGMLGLENSNLTLESVVLDNTDRRRIRSIDSSLVLRNSTFTNIFDPGERPTTDNLSEHVWGRGVPAGGQWVLENNVFGHITGHNDSIDFDSPRRPDPIAIIRDNVFMGGGDDALDMTGDVWVEGNTFQNFVKDEFNNDPGESNTISSSGGEFWVLRNTFRDVQHASLVKENAFMHFRNNTVVNSEFAPLYFDLPGQTDGPGRGAIVANSIFANTPVTFDQLQPDTDLSVSYSFLTDDAREFAGNGNLFGNPHVNADGSLGTGSFAIQAGSDGQDMGAGVSAGATIRDTPWGTTSSRNATLRIGGAGITHYRFAVDGGDYSDELPVETTIQLSNLVDGPHTVSVIGLNEVSIWQDASSATTSTWIVDSTLRPSIVISEVLADNQSVDFGGLFPDVIELHNPSSTPFDLSHYALSDDPGRPDRFVFPAGTVLGAGQYLTLLADVEGNENNTLGFALNAAGEGVYLFDDSVERGLIDYVEFGSQLPDLSISRSGPDREWGLSVPTAGQPNRAHPVADSSGVLINEWLAFGHVRVPDDFIELYNSSEFPADIGDHFLSDRPFAIPDMSAIKPLSFIAAKGTLKFIADGNLAEGPEHVAFGISPELEQLGLFTPELKRIDVVFSPPQTAEVSMGRTPDGGNAFSFREIPTPGATNGTQGIATFGFPINDQWRYDASGADLGTEWREAGFDDSSWESGQALIGRSSGFGAGLPIQTQVELGPTTYYFRKTFTLADDFNTDDVIATVTTQMDDGYVVYLNGQEVLRQRMPVGDIRFDTTATVNVLNASVEGPFGIPGGLVETGDNVLAIEVHQSAGVARDITFGLSFDATSTVVQDNPLDALDDGLRITEIMYHSAGDALDFIELSNVSEEPLDLTGVRLSDGVNFVFPHVMLLPGRSVVVAEDATAFAAEYGDRIQVAGEYSGNLSNSGEVIALQFPSPFDAAILRIAYSDDWYPETDGQGRSLEVVDSSLRFDLWSNADAWRASSVVGGTPGSSGPTGDLPGDFNDDSIVDMLDVDLLCAAVRSGNQDLDLDGNGTTEHGDLDFLVRGILGTVFGDANLDGAFDSGDLVQVFRAGEYEDGIVGNSTWADGDWNCDGEFSSGDLVDAFKDGGYSSASIARSDARTTLILGETNHVTGDSRRRDVHESALRVDSGPLPRPLNIEANDIDSVFSEPQSLKKIKKLKTSLEEAG